jgi:hypothetical protein
MMVTKVLAEGKGGTALAIDRNVSASTQNHAFNAIVFLFRHIFDKDIDDIRGAIRVSKSLEKRFLISPSRTMSCP